MEIDLKENLFRMRENYSKNPIRFKILPMPTWLRTTDGLYQIYRDKNNWTGEFTAWKTGLT